MFSLFSEYANVTWLLNQNSKLSQAIYEMNFGNLDSLKLHYNRNDGNQLVRDICCAIFENRE
uniref:Plasma membrane fusion protein PRM1 n=1 Tax=Parascaris univalens TaxID=6257 RepID=A0A914ZNE9_PARUN